MPFRVVRGVGRGMGVLDFDGDRQKERSILGVNLRRPIVTNGDFVDDISVHTIYGWNLCFIGFPKIYSSTRSMLGFDSNNWQNCNSFNTRKMAVRQHTLSLQPLASRSTLIRREVYSTRV